MLGLSTNRDRSNSALVPKVCEVCRSQPAEVLVVEFIFACDRCAEKIRAATGDQRATLETVFLVSEPKPNPQFPDWGGLSPNNLESLLKLLPAKKHSRHYSQRRKLRCSFLMCDRSVS
jgi:hypothetical protein